MSDLVQRLRALVGPAEAGESPRRARALRLLGLAIVAAFAAYAVRNVDLARLGRSLAAASVPWLALAAAANVLSLTVHAGRWRSLVRAPGVRVRLRDAFSALTAGLAVGMAIPARASDLVRAHLLARRVGLSTAALVGTTALDYVVGGAVLVPLLALLAAAAPLPAWAERALWVTLAVAALGGIGVWLLRPGHAAVAAGEEGRGMVARLRLGLSVAHEPRALATSVAWAFFCWGAEGLIAFFALAAFGLPATVEAAGLAVLATTAASLVSASPGNAGPFEFAAALAVMGFGVPAEPALAFALGYHLVHLAPTGLLGTAALVREARER